MSPALFKSSTGMPRSLRRLALASELETAPSSRPLMAARASMKWLTVDPVPTPTMETSFTYSMAASAAFFFLSSALIAGPLDGLVSLHETVDFDAGLGAKGSPHAASGWTGCPPWATSEAGQRSDVGASAAYTLVREHCESPSNAARGQRVPASGRPTKK